MRRKIAVIGVLALAALAVVGLTVAVIAGLLLIKPAVRSQIVDRARQRGIILEVAEFDYGLTRVQLRDAKFSLVGVTGIRGRVRNLEVALQDFKPVSVDATGVDLQAEGSATTLTLQLADWTKNYPQNYELPVVAKEVSLTWFPVPGGTPWLSLAQATVVPAPAGCIFSAKRARVAGIELGEVGAAWTKTEAHVGFGLGLSDLDQAPVRVSVNYAEQPPSASLTLKPTELAKLGGPLGMKLPLEQVKIQGTAHLVLPPVGQTGTIGGDVQLQLLGYVPPHPVELSGFVFGNVTKFDTKLSISEDRTQVTLTDSRVQAGAFVLKGSGQVLRHAQHAQIQLGLRGNLPCTALADAAAQTHLGKAIGGLVGEIAKRTLKGSVAVLVRIDADTRDLAAAKVIKTIGVGCGLKPLDPDAARAIGDLLDMVELPPPSSIPALPSALPPLPSALTPPRLPLPQLRSRPRDGGR